MEQIAHVQCYAGRKAEERPVRFRIGDRDHMVEEIVEQWYGPDGRFYKVHADDHSTYLLCLHTSTGEWGGELIQRSIGEWRLTGWTSRNTRTAGSDK